MHLSVANTISALAVLASAVWLLNLAGLFLYRKNVHEIVSLPDEEPSGGWPSLAVVFAARNEAAEVERATRSMLAQDYPALEVIAVDDRSTDDTGAILDAIAAEDPRLRVVHVRELPPGWLGKNHALEEAGRSTSAEWILFTDADVVLAPGTLRRSVAWAVAQGADHLTALPSMPTESVGERVFMSMFGLLFLLYSPIWRVEDPHSGAHIGIGAFNLIRAEALRAIGGLSRLALSVDDDMRIGQALKVAGYSTRVLSGFGALSVRWHVGLVGMIRGVEKNFFAGLDFSLAKVLGALVVVLWLGAGPHVGLFFGPWWARVICGLGIASVAVLLHWTARPTGVSWYYALTLPAGAILCNLALARSVWLTLRQQGVRWRGHHYHLHELRSHVAQRNAWTREVWKSTR